MIEIIYSILGIYFNIELISNNPNDTTNVIQIHIIKDGPNNQNHPNTGLHEVLQELLISKNIGNVQLKIPHKYWNKRAPSTFNFVSKYRITHFFSHYETDI